MTEIRYRDLTPHQREVLVELGQINGCGAKGFWVPVPDWTFTASCDHHDFNYWLGGTKEDRAKADWQFYQAMCNDAKEAPWYKRGWYATMAWVYYRAVRYYSARFFPFGEMKTLEDVQELVRQHDSTIS